MRKLVIIEQCRYEVEGETVIDAFREFLRWPNKYLTGVEERHVTAFPDELTEEESEEIAMTEVLG